MGRGEEVLGHAHVWQRLRRYIVAAIPSLCALAGMLGVLAFSSTPAFAGRGHVFEKSFGAEGSGDGEFKEPEGVAVSEGTSDVYVVDKGNNRVERFAVNGTFVATWGWGVADGVAGYEVCTSGCRAGIAGSGEGQFSAPEAIAVDNSKDPADPSAGDVYVAESNAIEKFSATGTYIGKLTEASFGEPLNEIIGMAVDPGGELWVDYKGTGFFEIHVASFNEASPTNEFTAEVEVGETLGNLEPGLAVDSHDDLYVKGNFYNGVTFTNLVRKYSSSGAVLISEVGEESAYWPAVESPSEDSYLGQTNRVGRYTPAGELIEYLGEGKLASAAGVGVNSAAETVYVADSRTNAVDIFPHEPAGPPTVAEGSESVSEVTATSASVSAEINPRSEPSEEPTSYRFEYGRCATSSTCAATPFEANLPVPDGQLSAGYEPLTVTAVLGGLQPSTVYHLRVFANNSHGPVEGEELTFTTQPTGPEFALPDNRAWELVSPPDKHGALIYGIGYGLVQSAVDGGAITYVTSGPVEEHPQGNRLASQVVSRRGTGGWSSWEVAAPVTSPTGLVLGEPVEYRLFSSDLSVGLLEPAENDPLLSEEASAWTPYLRHDFVSSQSCQTRPSACWTPLVTSTEGYADVQPPGLAFGRSSVQGATEDLGHVVLRDAERALYEWTAAAPWEQRLSALGVLPQSEGGKMVECKTGGVALLGDENDFGMGHAISRDGSRVFWELVGTNVCGASALTHHLYLRDTSRGAEGETLKVDVVQPGGEQAQREAEEPGPSFQAASADGSRVFFTDKQRLTEGSGSAKTTEESGDLYECEVKANASSGAFECVLSDLTPVGYGNNLGLQGKLLGASEDGSYLYFAANAMFASAPSVGECASSKPQATCNLYVAHESEGKWKITFIRTLSTADDKSDWSTGRQKTSSVSPNGRWLAFTSDLLLPGSGYDNRDVASGQRDEEVLVYDAQVDQEVCASCDPTGARPVGEDIKEQYRYVNDFGEGPWQDRWVAATVPSLTRVTLQTSPYQSRYLSDSGRLFFDAHPALTPYDKNGTWDVYQYEPPASGSCTTGSDAYSERSGGCVSLISSGTSGQESAFLDASESGDDVFFLTAAKLVPSEDYDTAYDVYDAHVCSGESPCITAPVSSPACTTADSCREAPASQPSVFGPPPSSSFSGEGNVKSASAAAVIPKVLTRKQKLAKALRACHAKHSRRKRRVCERLARRRYGVRFSRESVSRWGGR